MQIGIRHQQVSKWRHHLKEPENYRAMLFGAAYAKATLWTEWRAGHQLRAVERSGGGRPPENSSDSRTGFRAAIESYQLHRNMAYRWISMSHAPREAVEAYIDTKESAGGPLKRSVSPKIGKAYRPPECPLK